jgi:signal transduction histidine kinase
MHVRACDLSAMAWEVVDAIYACTPELEAQVDIEPGLVARGVSLLVHSGLQNLLGNALKYSSRTPSAEVHFASERANAGEPRFFCQ